MSRESRSTTSMITGAHGYHRHTNECEHRSAWDTIAQCGDPPLVDIVHLVQ